LTVSPRLYNFGGQNGASDPTLDANYTATLRGQCKPGDNATLVYLDPPTPTTFDADYYTLVAGNKGLLSTDAALLLDATTSAYVERQANATAPPGEFFADFATSFVAMSKLGVLTHHNGEIRQVCSKVNPPASSTSAAAAQLMTATGGLAVPLALAVALVL
jgi:peroxidase